ncbi:hypothetical protein BR93DRAFT_931654 [Coniochaeta sp. PMI_546]|nr:hypothetical protein BR93DRAFT_931654 [Coniochaeta sp. PMI_546]
MTGEPPNTIYPQYCFHLSPTIETWCRFRAQEIHNLTSHKGFEGQDLYFHVNHPIKWVQVAGVVVAIDEFYGKRIYTVDDSSGATIECVLNVPKQKANLAAIAATAEEGNDGRVTQHGTKTMAVSAQAATSQDEVKPVVDGDIDVGDILLVKGNITTFRNTKQIRVYKIFHLRCTEDEVQFWKKMTEFHSSVLSKPWTLTEKEVKRCRREATKSTGEEPRAPRRSKRRAVEADGTGLDPRSKSKANLGTPALEGSGSSNARLSGLERKVKHKEAEGLATTSIPKASMRTVATDAGGSFRTRVTGLERKLKYVNSDATDLTRKAETLIVTSTSVARGTSNTRITGLERSTKRAEADQGTNATSKSRTSTMLAASDGAGNTKARLTPMERNAKPLVEGVEIDSTSTSETEAVPVMPYRSSTRAKATGLERKPERVKTDHVEGKYDALGI